MKNIPAYKVAFAAGRGFQDVDNLLCGAQLVFLHRGGLATRAGTRSATGGFL